MRTSRSESSMQNEWDRRPLIVLVIFCVGEKRLTRLIGFAKTKIHFQFLSTLSQDRLPCDRQNQWFGACASARSSSFMIEPKIKLPKVVIISTQLCNIMPCPERSLTKLSANPQIDRWSRIRSAYRLSDLWEVVFVSFHLFILFGFVFSLALSSYIINHGNVHFSFIQK